MFLYFSFIFLHFFSTFLLVLTNVRVTWPRQNVCVYMRCNVSISNFSNGENEWKMKTFLMADVIWCYYVGLCWFYHIHLLNIFFLFLRLSMVFKGFRQNFCRGMWGSFLQWNIKWWEKPKKSRFFWIRFVVDAIVTFDLIW